MSNKWPKCPTCLLRHRPEKCKGRVDLKEIPALIANDCLVLKDLADRIAYNVVRLERELNEYGRRDRPDAQVGENRVFKNREPAP